jgi:hypothetical protein
MPDCVGPRELLQRGVHPRFLPSRAVAAVDFPFVARAFFGTAPVFPSAAAARRFGGRPRGVVGGGSVTAATSAVGSTAKPSASRERVTAVMFVAASSMRRRSGADMLSQRKAASSCVQPFAARSRRRFAAMRTRSARYAAVSYRAVRAALRARMRSCWHRSMVTESSLAFCPRSVAGG